MDSCPHCGQPLVQETAFCPHCGTQLRVQPVQGEVMDTGHSRPLPRAVSPLKAAALSIIPGLGHWYAGVPMRGLFFFVGVVGPEVIGIDLDLTVIGEAIGIPLGLGGLGLWVFSAIDAYRMARRRNALST